MPGLFVLFWVNIAFLVAMFAFCYCGVKVLGRKGRENRGDDGSSHDDDDPERPDEAHENEGRQETAPEAEAAASSSPLAAGAPAQSESGRYGTNRLIVLSSETPRRMFRRGGLTRHCSLRRSPWGATGGGITGPPRKRWAVRRGSPSWSKRC